MISWNPENSKDFMKYSKILLKATEFQMISWNQQDLKQFHKIQHKFTEHNGIYWNPEISKNFMRSNRIWLKATEFYRISLNSLHISLKILLQISLWMSFMYFTAYFITDLTAYFITDFTSNFMLNPAYFIINFMKNVITCTRIWLKSTGFHYRFHFGFHSGEICNEFYNEFSKENQEWTT